MNRSDFQELADLRIKEARSLQDTGFFDGSYYLAGSAVECALKACLAKRTQQHDFPDKKLVNESHTYDLKKLLELAELRDELNSASMDVRNRWLIVQDWSEASRYQRNEERRAHILLEAIEDQSGGVLPWIKQRW